MIHWATVRETDAALITEQVCSVLQAKHHYKLVYGHLKGNSRHLRKASPRSSGSKRNRIGYGEGRGQRHSPAKPRLATWNESGKKKTGDAPPQDQATLACGVRRRERQPPVSGAARRNTPGETDHRADSLGWRALSLSCAALRPVSPLPLWDWRERLAASLVRRALLVICASCTRRVSQITLG